MLPLFSMLFYLQIYVSKIGLSELLLGLLSDTFSVKTMLLIL